MTALASSPLALHRDPRSDFVIRFGAVLVGTLRRHYGEQFAQGCRREQTLAEILSTLDDASLLRVAKDYEQGRLDLTVARTS